MRTLVLVTGAGRSGTSTMSGTLHHLGLFVPGPHLGANDTNPKGFFESRWSVRFHRRLAEAAGINDVDSRPEAFGLVQAALTDDHREQLRDFLTRKTEGRDQVVVKDPRTVWTQELWRTTAAELGLRTAFVTMLRHPAEVVGSRTTWYAETDDEAERRSYETFTVARWLNASLVNERETRGQPRAFVSYVDLLEDWRPVMATLADDLGLRYGTDPRSGDPSPVDDFIEPGLRRHRVGWDDLDVPTELQDVAEQVWQGLLTLSASHGTDDAASAGLDRQGERYTRLFAQAVDIAHDALATERTDAARRAAKRGETP